MSDDDPACCAASREEEPPSRNATRDISKTADEPSLTAPATASDDRTNGMTSLEGGEFIMGTDSDVGFPEDGAGPPRGIGGPVLHRQARDDERGIPHVRPGDVIHDRAERFGWSYVFEEYGTDESRRNIIQSVADTP